MAVHWIDPYINSNGGAIHGTLDGTTRNGTYSYPFALTDIYTTSSSSILVINGVSIADGDELRLKGLSESSFYYTGVGDIPLASCVNGYLTVDSAYITALNTYRSHINTTYSATSAPYVVYDPALLGDNQIVPGLTDNNFASYYTNEVVPTSTSTSNALSGYWQSKIGINSTIAANMRIRFIDPAYWIDIYSLFGTTRAYFMNFGNKITVTDGWTSETVRDGITILPFYTSSSANAGQRYLFSSSYTSSAKQYKVFDMPNTHILYFSSTQSYINSTHNIYLRSFTGAADSYFKLGSFIDNSGSSWNYEYYTYCKQDDSTRPPIHYGNHGTGIYSQVRDSGSPGAYGYPVIKYDNLFLGMGWYYNAYNYVTTIGNLFNYYRYSYNAIIANMNTQSQFVFLDNGHVYAATASTTELFGNQSPSSITFGSNITNFESNNPNFPGIGTGPLSGKTSNPSQYLYSSDGIIKMSPANWTDKTVLTPTATIIGSYDWTEINSTWSKLDTEGVDYKSVDHGLAYKHTLYIGNPSFNSLNMNFASNTYDNKPISLWAANSGSLNNSYTPLLSYNDDNNNLVVIGNTNAGYSNYLKGFIIPVTGSGTSTLDVGVVIDNADGFTNASAHIYALSSAYSYYGTSASTDSNGILTFSKSIPLSELDSDINYIGVTLIINNSGKDYSSQFIIKSMTAEKV